MKEAEEQQVGGLEPPGGEELEADESEDLGTHKVEALEAVDVSGLGPVGQKNSMNILEGVVKQRKKFKKPKAPPRPLKPSAFRKDPEQHTSDLVDSLLSFIWALLRASLHQAKAFLDNGSRFFRLTTLFTPAISWFIFAYIMWLAFSYSVAALYRHAARTLEPVCLIPIVGSQLPFCSVPSDVVPKAVDISKVATAQDELSVVMDSVGQNFDLARDMVGHEFVVRDLRIRVAASNLNRKKELAIELDSLIRQTKKTAKGLSRFTAKVSKSIDAVATFDEYAVKQLESISSGQKQAPSVPQRIMSSMAPWAAFQQNGLVRTEDELKAVFISTSARIGDKVRILIEDSFELGHGLDSIQETLDRIKELAIDEVGDLPKMEVLAALWTRLVYSGDYEQFKSHETLLKDMTDFYHSSAKVMEETVAALNRMEAELDEFGDDLRTPALILQEYPIQIIIGLLSKSVNRLEAGKKTLNNIEIGEPAPRPKTVKQVKQPDRGRTRTVSATAV